MLRVVEYRVPEPPAELTTCAPAPVVPADNGYDVASFLLRLDSAGDDCRRTLGALAGWLRDARRRDVTEGRPE